MCAVPRSQLACPQSGSPQSNSSRYPGGRGARKAPLSRLLRTGIAALLLGPGASPLRAELPPEDSCPAIRGGPSASLGVDATATLLREGMILGFEDLLALRELLPLEIWSHREEFFHEGMRMEIGPCHRRYPTSVFYAGSTRQFAGRARVDEQGNLSGYVAGLPFPPAGIDAQKPDAALRWAWNAEYRYRGAGPVGRFRIIDLPSSVGDQMTYEGWFYLVQTAHRADLGEQDYTLGVAKKTLFVSGGRFNEPFSARHLAWTQHRPREADQKFSEPDDVFVYVPTMRKIRRAATPWVDGVYLPRYRVGGDSAGGGVPAVASGSSYTPGSSFGVGGLNPTSAISAAQSENLRRGFNEMALRPNAYVWRFLGERVLLAPLNVSRGGYPQDENRNFGPSGLSVGSDRWDVRYAVVVEGAARRRGGEFDRLTLFIDYQTQQPLYVIARRANGRLVEVTIPLHRFSGDVFGYVKWPSGEDANVFDPVAAVSYSALDGSGWRREAYATKSVPLTDEKIKRYISSSYLARGH